MVKELHKNKQKFYICKACGFAYQEKQWAEKCEKYCEDYKSCSLEITKHAIREQ